MDIKLLFETIYYQREHIPIPNCINHKEDGKWIGISSSELYHKINTLSIAFLGKGILPGTKVCLFAERGSIQWVLSDLALLQIGAIVIPLHYNYTEEELRYIITDTETKWLIVDSSDKYISLNALNLNASIFSYQDLDEMESGSALSFDSENKLSQVKKSIQEDDVATIIYTSGSTGDPKGVMLTHKNMVSNLKSLMAVNPLLKRSVCVSFLPLSHVFERMTTYTYIASGVHVYFLSGVSELMSEIKEVRPHFMTAVPRILERAYDFLTMQIEDQGYTSNRIGKWALKEGLSKSRSGGGRILKWLKLRLADLLVYRKWRKALGGRLRKIAVGAAAMDPDLARLYSSAGIEIREGYGLTETSPAVSFNRFEPGGNKFGTVGMPIPGVEVQINDPDENGDGEILVRGPNVMKGYFKNPSLTKEVIDQDGWFHTGDVGRFIEGKFLKITDRKKNIFKTSSGRYVAPQEIEKQLSRIVYIKNCMIIGFQKPYVIALLVPDFERLESWSSKNEIHWTSPQFMVLNPKVNEFYQEQIDRINDNLKHHEKIKRFMLLYEEWTIDSGELSTTFKVKRNKIMENYAKEIDQLYSERRR